MVTKRRLITVISFIWVFCCIGTAAAQSDLLKASASLKGVDALYIRVSNLDPDLRETLTKESMTEAVLRSEIERKLESSGIKVEAEELFRKTGKENHLFFKIEIAAIQLKPERVKIAESTKMPPKKFSYRLRLEFRQEVALTRNMDIKVMATTWMRDKFGYRGLEDIRTAALSLTDMFVQDFLSENR